MISIKVRRPIIQALPITLIMFHSQQKIGRNHSCMVSLWIEGTTRGMEVLGWYYRCGWKKLASAQTNYLALYTSQS